LHLNYLFTNYEYVIFIHILNPGFDNPPTFRSTFRTIYTPFKLIYLELGQLPGPVSLVTTPGGTGHCPPA